MKRNPIETIMGAVVLLVAAVFLVFVYTTADLRPVKGYGLTASFSKAGGLKEGSDVRISGVKVGSILAQSIDPKTYNAVLRLSILPSVRLPSDTLASIESDGLLGGSYVRLQPGHSPDMLADGGQITHTASFQSLEDLVKTIIFLATDAPPANAPPANATPANATPAPAKP